MQALTRFEQHLRDAPADLPFQFDDRTLSAGLNFTLTTSAGDIDLFGEIPDAGNYGQLANHTVEIELFGNRCRCIDLPTLIGAKIASGRPKDLEVVAELRSILEEKK